MFTGRFVDAKEALALGLIDELVAPDAVYDSAMAWAKRLVDHPPRWQFLPPPRPDLASGR